MQDFEDVPVNKFKNTIKEDDQSHDIEEPKQKKERKERLKKVTKSTSSTVSLGEKINAFIGFFKRPQVKLILGAFFVFTGVCLAIAFTSFLFTWQADQDKVMGSWSQLFLDDTVVDNWLGKMGAIVSHLFIHQWFGIASFVFVLVLIVGGLKALLNISLLPFGKTISHGLFFLAFSSIALGFIFSDKWFFMGGTFGYQSNLWLSRSIGNIGTLMLLVFTSFIYLVTVFNFNFDFLKKKEEDQLQQPEDEPVLLINKIKGEEENSTKEVEFKLTNSENETPLIVHELNEIDLDPITEEKTETKEGVEFTVEKTEEEKTDTITKVDPLTEFGEYDPTLDLSGYQFPTIDLLEEHGKKDIEVNADELNANKNKIVETLNNFKIEIEKIKATIGPTVTLYEVVPKAGVRISKVKSLEDDIALSLSALGIRIIAPMPGKGTIGIEVPNQNPQVVSMKSLIASDKFQNSSMELPVALGKTISNETFIADLAKMPHLLVAGATGQGKSVGLNAILVSLLYKKHPANIKFVMIDPKKVELTLYGKLERHFLAKLPDADKTIITDSKKAINTLNSLVIEMEQRYELLEKAGLRNLKEYNGKFISRKLNPNEGHKYLPYIVVVIDEFADFIAEAGKEIEMPIARLAQKARAIGIHLIIATQRPSVNVITGLIKANFPSRIAFRVSSKIDSRTILDTGGADQLIGRGDMLFTSGNELIRLQCAFVDTPEVELVTDFIGNQRGYPDAFLLPEYIDETAENTSNDIDPDERDKLFDEAARIVVTHQQGSASLLQRKLKLGYNRAGRIVDQLEAAGIIGKFEGSKAREVLIKDILSLEQFLNKTDKTTTI